MSEARKYHGVSTNELYTIIEYCRSKNENTIAALDAARSMVLSLEIQRNVGIDECIKRWTDESLFENEEQKDAAIDKIRHQEYGDLVYLTLCGIETKCRAEGSDV